METNPRYGKLYDPKACYDIWGVELSSNGDYEISVDTDTDLDYAMYLIKQSYERNRA